MQTSHISIDKVAFVGNYLPRQCGIATFTTDLVENIRTQYPQIDCTVIPVTDTDQSYPYREPVRFELRESDLESYERAADYLNLNNVDVVCLQHEYGIFGGEAGSHILSLMQQIRAPIVTTLHTVLDNPAREYREVMEEIASLSSLLIVMSRKARSILRSTYGIRKDQTVIIPHGIPDMPFVDPNFYKDTFGVEGKIVLLTFGLLSPNKGIEYVIEALPEVIREYPDVVYLVVGATHPTLLRRHGEAYRLGLIRLAEELGVSENIRFINKFLSADELRDCIGVSDIYVTPYLSKEQITSGTLAYSYGTGKAVVSTPYWHARELLDDGRGILVPFRDSGAIAEQVIDLITDPARRHQMRKNAWLQGREMIWPNVAVRYVETFRSARMKDIRKVRRVDAVGRVGIPSKSSIRINLDHIQRLTDSTGIIQFAHHTVPDFSSGYTTCDNSRALVLMMMLEGMRWMPRQAVSDLAVRYLSFLRHAFDPMSGRFRNFMSFDRHWLEEPGSEDSHGRAVWALGAVIGRSGQNGLRSAAAEIFPEAVRSLPEMRSPRTWAYALLGIHEYLRTMSGDLSAAGIGRSLAQRFVELYHREASDEWPWFEPSITYDSAKLPQVLILSGRVFGDEDMLKLGLDSLRWFERLQTSGSGSLSPIGSNGFCTKDGHRAEYDQQPIEAHSMVSAALEAYRATADPFWTESAKRAFWWFLGRNDLGLELYDSRTGGCRDGLQVDRVNLNEGAESTICFHIALAEMRLLEMDPLLNDRMENSFEEEIAYDEGS